MKEQDLREKLFQSFYKELKEDAGFYDEETSKVCVKIAKDYAGQKAIEFSQWMHENTVYSGDGFYSVLLGFEKHKHNQTLTECYQLFKNRENER